MTTAHEPDKSLAGLLSSKEIVVFTGSGGVGKTSTAAAAGAYAAAEIGGKVLVLTIDPARRLATALGLDGIGNVEREVPREVFEAAGVTPRGRMFAAMLDTKRSWDDLVHRHAPNAETAYAIISNPLYENITNRFINAHEYIAMERLYEIHTSGEYDLIIVDTPPTRSAIDFLEAPKRMAEFFGGRFLKILTLPYRAGGRLGAVAVDIAARPFYRLADRVLGSSFMRELGEFFLNFQTMNDGFVERAGLVDRLLHDGRTAFTVVTTLEAAPLCEAEFFCVELSERGYDMAALILNRVLPPYFLDPEAVVAADSLQDPKDLVKGLQSRFGEIVGDADRAESILRTVAANYRNFGVVAAREAELRRELGSGLGGAVPDVIASVPQFAGDIGDIDGLIRIGRSLFDRD